ncbi:SMI1/KNR4 family protein [Spiractinospora alimapuensis]|uniref:SMI1/KNR4 family protein n=1 Tax=Spiractinospora alimapuensis TaxID=2820884 RepID=UPI001F1E26E6|nr:SMI1/KNR4 family protein [Spiractinospora alimapuensis]QVQ53422.1 SMI1/KNR4 family protein [Spiractinospora alimapuensis]
MKTELVRLDAARPEEMVGCGPDELDHILAEFPEVRPPEAYLVFMRELGRNAGNLFRGSNYGYADCLSMRDHVVFERRHEDPGIPAIEGRFFFGHHQGYVLYFFKPDDERVWLYIENDPPEQVTASSFQEHVAQHIGIPERYWRIFRDDEKGNRRGV